MRKITTKPATTKPATVTVAKPAPTLPKLSAKAKAKQSAAIVAPVSPAVQVAAGRSNVAAPVSATPIARVAASLTGTKPATTKPAAKPATVPAPATSKLDRFTFRDAAFLESARYPTGSFSDLDSNYLGYFAGFAKATKTGIVNVAAIDTHDVQNNVRAPGADGGGKLNNRARLHRLVGSGHCAYTDAAGHRVNGITSVYFVLTDKAKTLAVVTKATARNV